MNKFTVVARLDIQSATGTTTLVDIESYLTDMLEVPQDPETEPGEPFYVTDLTVEVHQDERRKELARLEAAFEEAGGRGVELAERIDELRAQLGEEDA